MTPRRVAKILEVGPYPPPLAGWSIRIRFLRHQLIDLGHECRALNIGKSRKVPSDDYITVRNGVDYICKTFWYAARGYTIHMHTNGDGPVGFLLSLIAAIAGCICGRRIVLSLHAGTHQRYFPRERSKHFLPVLYLLFKLPKIIICNNNAVKEKIKEYHISPEKIIPIRSFGSHYVISTDASLPEPVEAFFQRRNPIIVTYVFLREGFHLDTLVQGMRKLVDRSPNIGLVSVGSPEDYEAPVKVRILQQINDAGLNDHICFAGDLSHDQFHTVMHRSKLYLRTPTTDGECASVLEALTLNVPVVAAENGSRPPSVVTYEADDPDDLCAQVMEVVTNHDEYCAKIVKPAASDTMAEEADALVAVSLGKSLSADNGRSQTSTEDVQTVST